MTTSPSPSPSPSGGPTVDATARPRLIGMLGGMSWESTAQYYRLANELVRDRLGGLHSARILLASLDFAEMERLQVAGEWDRAGQLLAEEAARLEAGGAELLLLCTNTMHKVAERVQAAIGIPLLHLADTTAAAVRPRSTAAWPRCGARSSACSTPTPRRPTTWWR